MVRECRPREREPVRSWLARRSTMATSTPASASSPANISPVGPPPATTTAWSAIRHPPFPQVLVSAGNYAALPGSCRQPLGDRAVVQLLPYQEDVRAHGRVVDPVAWDRVDQLLQARVIGDQHHDRHAGMLLQRLLYPRSELLGVRRPGREDDVA